MSNHDRHSTRPPMTTGHPGDTSRISVEGSPNDHINQPGLDTAKRHKGYAISLVGQDQQHLSSEVTDTLQVEPTQQSSQALNHHQVTRTWQSRTARWQNHNNMVTTLPSTSRQPQHLQPTSTWKRSKRNLQAVVNQNHHPALMEY